MEQVSIYRGDTWTRAWRLQDARKTPIDLTGATARLQVRNSAGAVVINATTSNGRLIISTTTPGRIDLSVPYTQMELAPGAYPFDLEVTHANGVRRTYESSVLVILPDVTRD